MMTGNVVEILSVTQTVLNDMLTGDDVSERRKPIVNRIAQWHCWYM